MLLTRKLYVYFRAGGSQVKRLHVGAGRITAQIRKDCSQRLCGVCGKSLFEKYSTQNAIVEPKQLILVSEKKTKAHNQWLAVPSIFVTYVCMNFSDESF